MSKIRVLFVCVHNAARSQMAEALLNHLAGDRFEAESAGLEPGKLNPFAVKAMDQMGIDISNNRTKSVFDLYLQGHLYRYVVTVCDADGHERCPVFPGISERINWSFPDPAGFEGSDDEKLIRTIEVRDALKQKIEQWVAETSEK